MSPFDVSRELEEKVILEKQSLQMKIKKKPQNLKCKPQGRLKN